MLILKTFLARRNNDDDTIEFPCKEEQWLYGPFSKRRNRLKIWALFEKGRTSRRYGISSERKNKSKIWNFFRKEEQVEDMDFLQKGRMSRRYGISSKRKNKSKMWTFFRKEEQVKDMDYPLK